MWRDVFKPGTTRLFFRYDPGRQLIQIQQRGEKFIVDLTEYEDDIMAQGSQVEAMSGQITSITLNDAGAGYVDPNWLKLV